MNGRLEREVEKGKIVSLLSLEVAERRKGGGGISYTLPFEVRVDIA